MPLAVALTGIHRASAESSPGWVGYMTLIVVLVGFASIVLWLTVASFRHRRLGGDDPSDGDGRRGGGPEPNPNPPDRSPDSGPVWWPEFERQFAAYVDSRRTKRQQLTLTGSR